MVSDNYMYGLAKEHRWFSAREKRRGDSRCGLTLYGQRGGCARPWSRVHVFERRALARRVLCARLGHALLEAGVVLEAVLEPVVFRLEAEQNARGLAATG